MAYVDFPQSQKGMADRKAFWLSPDGIVLISQWRREGIPLEQIAAEHIGVSSQTLWRWTKGCPELGTALGISKDVTNGKVEQALLKRALGYTQEEETWELVEGTMRKTKVVQKHVPPDVKACLSWLFSRRPDRWRAQQAPVDESAGEMETAKRILVAIEEVANGNSGDPQPKAD